MLERLRSHCRERSVLAEHILRQSWVRDDDLLARVPTLIDGRNEEIRLLYGLVTNVGKQGLRAARTQGVRG